MKRVIPILLIPLLASADPGAATRYLMNEPASLFDIAMVRLEAGLNKNLINFVTSYRVPALLDYDPIATVTVSYDFDSDAILASIDFIAGIDSFKLAEKGCRETLQSARLLVALLPNYFHHYGYIESGRPKDINEEVQERIYLVCTVGTLFEPNQLRVSRPFSSDQFSVIKKDDDQ